MIIDAHIHVGQWNHPDFLGRSCTLEDTIEVLGKSGISGAALCPTDRCDNEGLLSDARAALRNGYDGKLWIFPWVLPGEVGAEPTPTLQFVRDNLDSICGVKLHPSLSRKRLTDESFAPILEVANQHELVVLVHCGRWQEIASYRFAVQAAARYPRAKFLLAHAGGDTPPLASAAAQLVFETKADNIWFEFSGLREYWVIERNCALLGASRYLMGSDYGLAHPLMYIGAVAGMNLPESDKNKILSENAIGLFGSPLGSSLGSSAT